MLVFKLEGGLPSKGRIMKSLWLALLILLYAVHPAKALQSAESVHEGIVNSIAAEAESRREHRLWAEEREELGQEIRNMKMMDSWLEFQNKKYARYLEKQKKVIAELERRKEEARRIRMELEPFLETIVDRLDEQVAVDLPFLADERARRIAFLRDSLDDYRLELSEKLRRVFEALQVETEYGRTVEVSDRELEFNGASVQAVVFRLGRTALYFRTKDGTAAGVWDREKGSWKELAPEFAGELKRAEEMASRRRAVELLSLPVGGPR